MKTRTIQKYDEIDLNEVDTFLDKEIHLKAKQGCPLSKEQKRQLDDKESKEILRKKPRKEENK